MNQDEALVPHTINTALPVIPLERTTAEAEASTLFFNLNFTSRPTKLVRFDSIGNRFAALRTKYEYSTRDGEADLELLRMVPEREQMRHFDVAARDRNQFTADLSVDFWLSERRLFLAAAANKAFGTYFRSSLRLSLSYATPTHS